MLAIGTCQGRGLADRWLQQEQPRSMQGDRRSAKASLNSHLPHPTAEARPQKFESKSFHTNIFGLALALLSSGRGVVQMSIRTCQGRELADRRLQQEQPKKQQELQHLRDDRRNAKASLNSLLPHKQGLENHSTRTFLGLLWP